MSSASRTLTSTVPSRRSVASAGGGVSGNDVEVSVLSKELIDVDMAVLLLRSSKLRHLKNDAGEAMHAAYCRSLGLGIHLGGYIPVSYRVPTSGFGRYTSRVSIDDGLGHMPMLCTMKREVRNLLADKHYVDVDFVNCHPVILAQLLHSYQIDSPHLTRYIEQRESCLREVTLACGISRDIAKELFIRLSYLGSMQAWMLESGATGCPPAWVGELSDELSANATRIVQRPELDGVRLTKVRDLRQGARISRRLTSSILSIYLQTLERRCLDALRDAMERDGFTIGALIHDGLHVLRGGGDADDGPDVSDLNLRNWRAHVLVTAGYDLEVKVKPFELDRSWLESDEAPLDPQWDNSWMSGSSIMGYPEMKALWEQRAFKVVVCGDFVRKEREKHAVYTRRKLVDAYEHLKTVSIQYRPNGEGSLVSSSFIKVWVPDKHLRKYEYMDTYPPPLVCPDHTYNCWSGFAASKYVVREGVTVDTDSIGVRSFIRHLDTLLSHDAASTAYVLDWVAQILQQPSTKTGIALLLKGGEGVGKNRFTDLLKLLLGEGLFLETACPEHVLFGRFTDARLGKFLIVINEASGSDNHAASENLKDMITSQTFMWEAKGRDGVQMRAYDRFIFTTNNSNVLKINPDSRRYVVFEVSGELKGNTAYFKELSGHIADEHARFEFYTLLMERDVSRVDWINDRPLTECFSRMVELNLPREYTYLRDSVILPAYSNGVATVDIGATELFQGFQSWLTVSSAGPPGAKAYCTTVTKFGIKIRELISGSNALRGTGKEHRKSGCTYLFDINIMITDMIANKWILGSDVPSRGCIIVPE